MTSVSLARVQISLSRSLQAIPSDWTSSRSVSDVDLMIIVWTFSGSRAAGILASSLYCCKSVSLYTALTCYHFQKNFLYALVDLEVLQVKSGTNTLCHPKRCMWRKCSLGVEAKQCLPLFPAPCCTGTRRFHREDEILFSTLYTLCSGTFYTLGVKKLAGTGPPDPPLATVLKN